MVLHHLHCSCYVGYFSSIAKCAAAVEEASLIQDAVHHKVLEIYCTACLAWLSRLFNCFEMILNCGLWTMDHEP